MTNDQQLNQCGRVAIEHFRDGLGLTHRALADAFQVAPDSLQDFLNGDDAALSEKQKTYIGLELAHLADEEDSARESLHMVYDAQKGHYTTGRIEQPPSLRQVLGITK